ncbi:MAG TPA: ribosome maturation factor RimM [Anaerolineaceae bacterium]|nr:ribosome maturation factor RimM [Anaerolineaceae bacterium]
MIRRRPSKTSDRQELDAGSPRQGEPVFLVVGRLRRPHGVKGEIILELITDFPQRLRKGITIYVGDDHLPLEIASRRVHPPCLLLSFREYPDRDSVGELRNELVYVRADQLPSLPEGEYYHHQLIGLEAVTEDETALGVLEEILETGAADVYLVRTPEGKELLFPALEEVIRGIDLEKKQITIRPQEWE